MNNELRIGYLVPEFPSQTHAFFWREMKALEMQGAQILPFSTKRPPDSQCPHTFCDEARARTYYLFPLRFRSIFRYIFTRPRRVIKAISYVLGLRETPVLDRLKLLGLIGCAADLSSKCQHENIGHVHIHSCANSAHLGALAHILGGINYSLTLHGDLQVYGTDHPSKMGSAKFVSAVTKPLAKSVLEIVPNQTVPVIWMGVDVDQFTPSPKPRTRSDPRQPFDVATVARLHRVKGHRFFLQAMAALKDEGLNIRFHIAGEGPDRKLIEAEVERLKLGNHVNFLGAIREEKVLSLLQSVDAVALTSIGLGEAAPVAVMEAMSCGVPVVCSVIGGTPDMITDEKDGFLMAQEDVSAIADTVRRLATAPDLGARIGTAARQTALKKFDYRIKAQELFGMIVSNRN